jgi:hypothetical protein
MPGPLAISESVGLQELFASLDGLGVSVHVEGHRGLRIRMAHQLGYVDQVDAGSQTVRAIGNPK